MTAVAARPPRYRRLLRALRGAAASTWNPATGAGGEVDAVIVFPTDALNLPDWKPGPGFRTVTGSLWWRPDDPERPHGPGTAFVAHVSPKTVPSYTGGTWTEPEVWTVHLDGDYPRLWTLRDKLHRVTHCRPEQILHRAASAGHPSQQLADHFARIGFHPDLDGWLEGLYADRPYLGLRWTPYDDRYAEDLEPSLGAFAAVVEDLARRYGGRVRLYPQAGRRQPDRCPVRCGHIRQLDLPDPA